MSGTYADVDRAVDPSGAADWQDGMEAWPTVRAYKQRTYALLEGHRPVLDIGCGTGVDIAAIGGSCMGVDPSAVMTARTRSRGNLVARGDALRLPFGSSSVGGARADRVVQHLADPEAGVAEMCRVVRPGGVVVVSDPDQGSLVIEVPGVPPDLVETLRRRRDLQYRNGTFARRLPHVFAAQGLTDVTVDGFVLVLTDPDLAFGLPSWVSVGHRSGACFSDEDVRIWAEAIRRARVEGGFVYAVTFFVVAGRKPA